jgi:hypothetical protein
VLPLVAGIIATVCVALAVASWPASYDDAYITYTYARSFAEGRGLTFNGEPGLGTTSPLLAVVLASLAWLTGLEIPLLGHASSWLAVAATGWLLLGLGRRERWFGAAVTAALVWPLLPSTISLLGGEMLPLVAVAVGVAWALAAGRPTLVGGLLAVALGLRAEAAWLALVVAASVRPGVGPGVGKVEERANRRVARAQAAAPRARRAGAPTEGEERDRSHRLAAWVREVARIALPAAAVFAVWLLVLAWLTGGELVPRTLAAKQAQAASPYAFWHSGTVFVEAAQRLLGQALGLYRLPDWVTAVAAAAGLVTAWRRGLGRGWWVLVVWGVGHLGVMLAVQVPFYPWYALPAVFAGLLLVAALPEVAPRGRWVLSAGLGVGMVVAGWPVVAGVASTGGDPRRQTYGRLADWIAAHHPPEVTVATIEVGYLGYRNQFRVRDLLGLVTPEVPLDRVRRADMDGLLEALDPDLVLVGANRGSLVQQALRPGGWLTRRTVLEHLQLDGTPPLLLYRARDTPWPVPAPAPARAPGDAPVLVDYYPLVALRRSDAARIAPVGALQLPVVVVPPGEELVLGPSWPPESVPVPAGGAPIVFTVVAAGGAVGRLELTLRTPAAQHALGALELGIEPQGPWSMTLPEGVRGRLVVGCRAAAECLLALPHLRWGSALSPPGR